MTIAEFINKIGFKIDDQDVDKVNSTISGIKDTATRVLGAIGVGLSLASVNELVEEFTLVNNQIRNATSSLGAQRDVQQQIMDAAEATRTSYADTANVVAMLVKGNSELFGNVDEAVKFNNAATMLFKSAGKTNEQIAGLMEAINKSFQKGYVDSETISQLLEQAPEAVQLLNQRLGTTSDKLEDMASDGSMSVTDLKMAFLDSSAAIESEFGNVQYSITDALTVIRSKWGLWLAQTNETLGLTDSIGRFMVSAFNKVIGVLDRVRNGTVWLADKLGGVDNLLRLIAISAGIVFVAFSFDKIKSGLSSISKLLTGISMKTMAIIAVVILLALLVDDFINFMQGNDSVIGTLLANAGVDVDKFRESVIKIWGTIKTALSAIWAGIKDTAIPIFQGIWDTIKSVFESIGGLIETIAPQFADFMDNLANGNVDVDQMREIGQVIGEIGAAILVVVGVLKVCSVVIGIVNAVMAANPITWIILAIVLLIAVIVLCVKNWDKIKEAAASAWEWIKNAWASAGEWFNTNVIQPIVGFFTGLWNSITTTVTNIKNTIVSGFTAAIDWIKSLPSQALQWGADIIQGIVDGITGAIGKVGEAVSGVANKIKSFLGFSEPDEGPLSDFHTYMPDMIDLMSKGITAGREKVRKALQGVTGDMSVMARANIVDMRTASAASGSSQISKSVVQNVNINNRFEGDKAGQQKSAAAMDKAAGDTTAQLARGLAYAG